ncbi:LacI family DNA-binding transcriptional regulator [Myceligenerans crystallogenes]|uniref:LacI family DNA-binding transcriptional regulator n=1 Tax=Myceligenerans crystallogenes TaxID=316335 RepID=A0ABP4ZFL0_9MICO
MAKVTLQSIADKVGVSRMTVSNAFSRPDQLSADLRERILAAAADLGYSGPDPAARALARGRTGSVGMLINGRVSESFTETSSVQLLASVADDLAARGLALTLLTPPPGGGFVPARDVAVDAVLVYSCDPRSGGLEWLARRKIPMVTIDETAYPGAASVNIDDRGGARAVAQHLVDLGHRRIGIIGVQDGGRPGPSGDLTTMLPNYPMAERMAGWREAIDAAADDDGPGVLTEVRVAPLAAKRAAPAGGPRSPSLVHEIALDLLDHDVTAIICFADVFVPGVYRAAAARGLSVPGDLSVVGFDDDPLAETLDPPLTTVRQDVPAKGRAAVAALAEVMAGRMPAPVLHPTELVVRGSTAPPS